MKKWILPETDKEQINNISKKYRLPYFTSTILASRGFTVEKENIYDVLYKNESFCDPFEIKDMDKACSRINEAVENHERICIYGDYDADGVCSIAMLYMYLNEKLADVSFYVPDREVDGYGISKTALDKFKEDGIKLLITVDNGIASMEEADYANEIGIELVIVDHHRQQGESIPQACAVVDPHQNACQSKFKDYCAAGLVFKLITAMEAKNKNISEIIGKYIAIAAIGTIGDAVPILGENRKIIRLGLHKIKTNKNSALKFLFEMSGIYTNKATATDIAFSVVPKVNASGRMSSAKKSVKMLICDDDIELRKLAEQISYDNQLRQKTQANILEQVKQIISQNPNLILDRVIVIDGDNWHKGVIGIVASRIVDIYDKPCIIISSSDDICTASGRSIEGFSLHDAIYSCREYFTKFGGHHMAVGFSMKKDKIHAFREAINEYAKNTFVPYNCVDIDCELKLKDLNISILDELDNMQPFGKYFKEPIVMLSDVKIEKIIALKAGKYIKLVVSQASRATEVICFCYSTKNFPFNIYDKVDIIASLNKNEYNSVISLNMMLKDIRLHSVDYNLILEEHRKYEAFLRNEHITLPCKLIPTREDFIIVYNLIKAKKSLDYNISFIFHLLRAKLAYFKICVIIDILCETALIEIKDDMIFLLDSTKKVNLFESEIFNKLKSCLD